MRPALLAATVLLALGGCNLTYDREGVKFEPPPSVETCAAKGLSFCQLGSRAFCADLTNDRLNCGTCGTPCGIGVDCITSACGSGGAGYCGAIPGESVCGYPDYPVCVDTLDDPRHCGSCNVDCGTKACTVGVCAGTCVPPQSTCNLGAGEYCANLSNDPSNCGACGNVCAPGTTCGTAGCEVPCTAPYQVCGTATAPVCVNTFSDKNNCGSCGLTCASSCWAGQCDGAVAMLTVDPVHPLNGGPWNSWVAGGSGTPVTDALCPPATASGPCTHAGELRQVVVPGKTSCAGLTLAETLDAFQWTCSEGAGAVRFTTSGFAAGKGLADLLEISGGKPRWRPNSVAIWDGGANPYGESDPLVPWWSNPVAKIGGGNLATSGTIYVADGTEQVPVTMPVNGVGLVILRGVTLAPAVAGGDAIAGSGHNLWLEGAVDSSGAAGGISLTGNYSVARGLKVARSALPASGYGLRLSGSWNRVEWVEALGSAIGIRVESTAAKSNTLAYVHVADAATHGIHILNATGNQVSNAAVERSGTGVTIDTASDNRVNMARAVDCGIGFHLVGDSQRNVLGSIFALQSAYDGVALDLTGFTSALNVVVGAALVNNRGSGMTLRQASGNVLALIDAVGNEGCGVMLWSSDGDFLMNLVARGNVNGLCLSNGGNHTLMDVVALNSSNVGVQASFCPGNTFLERLLLGGNVTNCDPGTLDPGFTTTCFPTGASSFSPTFGVDTLGSFVGRVMADDVANASDYLGSADLSYYVDPSFDWSHFDAPLRAWQADTPTGGIVGCTKWGSWDQPSCQAGGGAWAPNGRIWDWSLRKTDGVLREVLPPPAFLLSVDVGGAPVVIAPGAVELLGNGNGVCDPSDAFCLFTPNLGAYQGHGVAVDLGTLQPPATTRLLRFDPATNGY